MSLVCAIALAACTTVEFLPVGGQTQVLVLGDNARRAPLVPPTIEFAAHLPAWVLHYAEAPDDLPWASRTSLGGHGQRVPLPMDLWVRTATAWRRTSGLSAGWRVSSWAPSQSCAGLQELQPETTTAAKVVRWTDREVLESSPGLLTIRSRAAVSKLGRAAYDVDQLQGVGARSAVAGHFRPPTVTWVTTDGPSQPSPVASEVHGFAGQYSGGAAVAFAWTSDGRIQQVTSSSIGPAIPNLSLDPDADNAIYAVGPELVVRRGLTALHYPGTSTRDSVDPLTRPYLREITAVALLPSLGATPDGQRLGVIAAATAVLPGDPDDKRTAILLRYSDEAREWRPHAIIDDFGPISQLAEHQGEVLFAGHGGWGLYSPKNGACRGEGAIAPVEQVVALADGSFYLLGVDRQDPQRGVAAWLVPE